MNIKRTLGTMISFFIISIIFFNSLIGRGEYQLYGNGRVQIDPTLPAEWQNAAPADHVGANCARSPLEEESLSLASPNSTKLLSFFNEFPYKNSISIFYHNLETGFIFGFRDDLEYTSASLNKASHAFYIYYLAENGMADLERRHTLRASDMRGGTGIIQFMPIGTVFTERELLAHSIIDSDNIAFRMLVQAYENHEFSYFDFIEHLGGNTELVRNITGRWFSASEAGFVMERIHRYLESGGMYSEEFRYNLMVADAILFPAQPAAQKYGHWREAFHTMSLIYSPSPYILTILTNLGNHPNNFKIIEQIYDFMQRFNERYFES